MWSSILVWTALSSPAFATDAPGSSAILSNLTGSPFFGVTGGITWDGSALWAVVEYIQPVVPGDDKHLVQLMHQLVGSWEAKNISIDTDLVGDEIQHLPSIAMDGTTDLWATAKQNRVVGGVRPPQQLEMFKQDPTSFATAATAENMTSGTTLEYGRTEVVFDSTTSHYYTCFTRRDAANDAGDGTCDDSEDDDVQMKARNSTNWSSSTLRTVSSAFCVIEDHCSQQFLSTGDEGMVFHQEDIGGGNPADDGIYVNWATVSGGWTDHVTTQLPDSDSTNDFPWISMASNNVYVVAETLDTTPNPDDKDLEIWACLGATSWTSCDDGTPSSGEWLGPTTLTITTSGSDQDTWDPHLLALTTGDEILMWEDHDTDKVHLAVRCDPATGDNFVDKGVIPKAGTITDARSWLGAKVGSGAPAMVFDGTNIDAVVIEETSAGKVPVLYTVALSTLCP